MKQHITIDQLASFTKYYKKIIEFVVDDEFEQKWFVDSIGSNGEVSVADMGIICKLVTIGKMMEIIFSTGYYFQDGAFEWDENEMVLANPARLIIPRWYLDEEIEIEACLLYCDALWVAVKYILEYLE